MKRGLGVFLAGLGAFLLVTALLLKFVAVPKLEVAPLTPGTDGISTTTNVGVAKKLFYPGKLASGENPTRTDVPLKAVRTTRGDVLASTTPEAEAANLVVYDSFQNVTDDEGTTIDASTMRIAFNRVDSTLTNCCGANVDGKSANFVGISPLKFPFNVQQQDYDWYDTGLGTTAPARFIGTDTIDGVEMYKFQQTIAPYKSGELDVPGSLVGSTEATFKANRYAESDTTIWVDPVTGSIVKGSQHQHQYLAGPDGTTEALTIIDADLSAIPSDVSSAAADAGKNGSLLKTLGTTIPIIFGILGIILLVLGFVLATRKSGTDADGDTAYAPATTGSAPPSGNVDVTKPDTK